MKKRMTKEQQLKKEKKRLGLIALIFATLFMLTKIILYIEVLSTIVHHQELMTWEIIMLTSLFLDIVGSSIHFQYRSKKKELENYLGSDAKN